MRGPRHHARVVAALHGQGGDLEGHVVAQFTAAATRGKDVRDGRVEAFLVLRAEIEGEVEGPRPDHLPGRFGVGLQPVGGGVEHPPEAFLGGAVAHIRVEDDPDHLLPQVPEDIAFAGKVREEGALADVGGLGDVGDGDGVEPPLGEQPHGLGEDPLPGPGAATAHSITHGSTLEQNLTLVNI